jgi:translation elongation factor EF-G
MWYCCLLQRLEREYGAKCELGKPKVAFRECLVQKCQYVLPFHTSVSNLHKNTNNSTKMCLCSLSTVVAIVICLQ